MDGYRAPDMRRLGCHGHGAAVEKAQQFLSAQG